MKDNVADFRMAAATLVRATVQPDKDCFYGSATRPSEMLLLFEKHSEAVTERAKPLSDQEIRESIKWVEMFHKPTLELDRTIHRLYKLCRRERGHTL